MFILICKIILSIYYPVSDSKTFVIQGVGKGKGQGWTVDSLTQIKVIRSKLF